MKKILSLILSLAMVLSLAADIPLSAVGVDSADIPAVGPAEPEEPAEPKDSVNTPNAADPTGAADDVAFEQGKLAAPADALPMATENSGTCGDNLTWTYDAGTGSLVIGGTGAMSNYNVDGTVSTAPWGGYCADITSVIIGDEVTSIGNYAFYKCAITKIDIPAGVTSIGQHAFAYCNGLNSVTVKGKVKVIDAFAVFCIKNGATITFEKLSGPQEGWDSEWDQQYTLITVNVVYATPISGTCGAIGDNLTWTLEDGVLTISGSGDMHDFTSNDKPEWDGYKEQITSVVIEDGVTSIGDKAFAGYEKLVSVTISQTCLRIGAQAFDFCSALKDITIPEGVQSIGATAFGYNYALTDITVPESVMSIGNSAFTNCSELETIVIKGNIKNMGSEVFEELWKLKSLTFKTMTKSAAEALEKSGDWDLNWRGLSQCVSESKITWATEHKCGDHLTWSFADGVLTISGDGLMYPLDDERFDHWSPEEVREIVIVGDETGSSGLFKIPDEVFSNHTNLETVTIPKCVRSIGESAFEGCPNLNSVTVDGRIGEMGASAFAGCGSVKITFNDVTEPFAKYITYEDGQTLSWAGDFFETGLNVEWAPQYCGGLDDSGEFNPESVTWELNEEGLLTISGSGNMSGYTGYNYENGIYFNNSSMPWPANAVKKVYIDDGVKSVGDLAFWGCANLTEADLPDSLAAIGNSAFADTAIESIIIPQNVDKMAEYAFGGISGIDITVLGKTEEMADNNMWWSAQWCELSANVTWLKDIPMYCGAEGHGRNVWAEFNNDGTLAIKGKGAMKDYDDLDDRPWRNIQFHIFGVTVEDEVTTIGKNAFYDCPNLASVNLGKTVEICDNAFAVCTGLVSVTIPESVNTIGSRAFGECGNLENLTISEGVETISAEAFWFCIALTEVTIPQTVKFVGEAAFYNCLKLETVKVLAGETIVMGSRVFDNAGSADPKIYCLNITESWANREWDPAWRNGNTAAVYWKANYCGNDYINEFMDVCWELDDNGQLTIKPGPGCASGEIFGEAYYGDQEGVTWWDKTKVRSVVIKNGIKNIPAQLFYNCPYLETVEIPDTVENVGSLVFGNCSNDLIVNIDKTKTEVYSSSDWSRMWLDCAPEGITVNWKLAYCGGDASVDGENLAWELVDGILTIFPTGRGSGVMANYEVAAVVGENYTNAPWAYAAKKIKKVVLEKGVASIGECAFGWLSELTDFSVEGKLDSVGERAFIVCNSLKEITLPGKLEGGIGRAAFQGVSGLTINIPDVTKTEGKTMRRGYAIGFIGATITLMTVFRRALP